MSGLRQIAFYERALFGKWTASRTRSAWVSLRREDSRRRPTPPLPVPELNERT